MTTVEIVTIGLCILGLIGGLIAWALSFFESKDSANEKEDFRKQSAKLQENAINEIVKSGVESIKGEINIFRSEIRPKIEQLKDDVDYIKKKVDSHIEHHGDYSRGV